MSTSPYQSLVEIYATLEPALDSKPVIALIDGSEIRERDGPELRIERIPSLNLRYSDACLVAYWCSAAKSHESLELTFYSQEQIDSALSNSGSEPNRFIDDLLQQTPEDTQVGEATVGLIDNLSRCSIDDVFEAAERIVMQLLKERSSVVDAASVAAGIPRVTFHKRMKRLSEKHTLLSILGEHSRND